MASQRFSGWLIQVPTVNVHNATDQQLAALVKSADAINRMFGTDAYECSGQGLLPYLVGTLVDPNGQVLMTGA